MLNPSTLEELGRFDTTGRPRHILVDDSGSAYVHGQQGFVVTRISSGGTTTAATTVDPRPELVADGQAFFTGTGETYGESWGCAACHVDGLSDNVLWRVGPFPEYQIPRPLFWLEGTRPLGWSAYVDSAGNFSREGPVNIGDRVVTEEANALEAYLNSIMPPPAANSLTTRDGRLSEEAERGRELFFGEAGCASCHNETTGTTGAVFPDGITEGVTDVPGMVGIYRYGAWLKTGEARTMREAVVAALDYIGNDQLSEPDIAALVRYIDEWTARDFFVLASDPQQLDNAVPVDAPIELIFSAPVFDDSANLANITLRTAGGADVAATVVSNGRHVTITPNNDLDFDTSYEITVGEAFESFDERSTIGRTTFEFTTAAEPAAPAGG